MRPARRKDVPALAAMFASDPVGQHGDSADPAHLSAYLDAFDRIQASPNDTLYVAERSGEIVGTFQIVMITGLPGRGATNMLVKAVHTRQSARGEGIGAAMMRYCMALARERNVRMVQLMSNRDRIDAHRFYERLGFNRTHCGYTLHLE